MEQSSKDQKAAALKKLQAGKISVEELHAEIQGNRIDLEEFKKWVQQTYPPRSEAVLADLLQSEGEFERMAMQTLELVTLFYASLHPEDDEKERNWLPWTKLHYLSTDFGDSDSVPYNAYPSTLDEVFRMIEQLTSSC